MKRSVFILLGTLAATATLAAQVSAGVDYDTFMKQDVQSRIKVFNQVSPEDRADIVRTQIQRWVKANRTRLTREQLDMTQEWLTFVTAENYRQPMADELKLRTKDLEARSAALFSKEDLMQAMTIRGTYIP
jgi:deoxyribodipyrimidine photolyase